jgi:pyruvate ferredoxin oxidoreductase alpha subunit
VRLPVIVNLDGFYLSFTREPVELPDAASVRGFLPPFDPGASFFRGGVPQSQGVAVLEGSQYSYFRYETHLAALKAGAAFADACADFAARFGRTHRAVERYCCEDAEYAFVMMGSFASKAKAAVLRLREAGWKIGLVRPLLLRPFPEAELVGALSGLAGVAVVDQNLSPGMGGVLASEIGGALYRAARGGPVLASFIGGLGGRDISFEEFIQIARVTQDAARQGASPPARLLFTRQELEHTRRLQAIARAGAAEG